MEGLGATSAVVGLAIPVFKCAKEVRDRIKLVRYPPHPLCTLRELIIILHLCSQVASENAELLAALVEYEKDINLLELLYNNNKELLDQHELDRDLKELEEYVLFFASRSYPGLTRWRRIIRDLDEWLNSVNSNLGKKKKLPGVKELWKSGDRREKLAAFNAKISSVRARWQVWGAAQVSEADCTDYHHGQARLQVCTLVSTNTILGRLDSVQTEMATQFQQVLTMLLTMLQQVQVRERSRSLSIHSQVEPVGFNSQTTRVGYNTRVKVHTDEYHSQVVANPTTSIVTFSVLSPDPSFSYDHIKLRLEEYRTLLASDSDTIELSTENGKTVICRKQATEMEKYLDQAEILLQGVVQSRDIPTIIVLNHLRDLTKVLDNLKLYDECRLTGDCALGLAEALGRRSLEFRHEQAETLAHIAGLSVYQPRARTLFIQAVSICEEVARNDASHSNKRKLLIVVHRAGCCVTGRLGAQWLGRAVQLMTKELPPAMVHPHFRSGIYHNYGNGLRRLEQYSNAIKAYHEAVSIRRILVGNDPAKHNVYFAGTLINMGIALEKHGKYDDAIVVYKEALEICTTMSTRDPLRFNELRARALVNYGVTLGKLNQVSEAAVVGKQAISILRDFAQTGTKCTELFCNALHNYGNSCASLGQHADAVLAYQESILLWRALAATDSQKDFWLREALHHIARSFRALDKYHEANTAATEFLERNHGRVLEDCHYAPDFSRCFVCQRGIKPDSVHNVSPPPPPTAGWGWS